MRQIPAQPHRASESGPAPERLQLVRFRVGDGHFGMDIGHVLEISRVTALTRVPQSAPGVRGVINLRGSIIPVLDLGVLLELGPATVTPHSRIMVLDIRGRCVGLLVDSAHEVTHIDRALIVPASACQAGIDPGRIVGLVRPEGEGGLLILLAPGWMLGEAGLSAPAEDHAA